MLGWPVPGGPCSDRPEQTFWQATICRPHARWLILQICVLRPALASMDAAKAQQIRYGLQKYTCSGCTLQYAVIMTDKSSMLINFADYSHDHGSCRLTAALQRQSATSMMGTAHCKRFITVTCIAAAATAGLNLLISTWQSRRSMILYLFSRVKPNNVQSSSRAPFVGRVSSGMHGQSLCHHCLVLMSSQYYPDSASSLLNSYL